MRLCIIGAGAIGGLLAVRLTLSGEEVIVVDRGAHLEKIRADGIRLITDTGKDLLARPAAALDRIDACGRCDFVILAVKAHQIAPVADQIASLFSQDSVLVTVQNGMPWWYFQQHRGPHSGYVIQAVDPDGSLSRSLDASRTLGCVAYPAARIEAPGVIRHVEGVRFPVGELDGAQTPRVQALSQAFIHAGLKSPILEDIRSEIWLKTWGALAFNPLSALTHAGLKQICEFPLTRRLTEQMMTEAQAIAGALGVRLRVPMEQRIEGAAKIGNHRTSMLQDVEAGEPLEIGALLGSIVELGRLTHTATPHIEAVYAALMLLDHVIASRGVRIVPEPPAAPHIADNSDVPQ